MREGDQKDPGGPIPTLRKPNVDHMCTHNVHMFMYIFLCPDLYKKTAREGAGESFLHPAIFR